MKCLNNHRPFTQLYVNNKEGRTFKKDQTDAVDVSSSRLTAHHVVLFDRQPYSMEQSPS